MIILLVLLAVVSLVPLVYWRYVLYKNRSLNKIPGPDPTPILGNIFAKDPYDLMKDINKLSHDYGSVFKIYTGPELKVFFAKPEPIGYIVSSSTHINKTASYDMLKAYMGDGLAMSGGKKWQFRRKVITPAFHFKVLDKYLENIKSSNRTLIRMLNKEVDKESVDLYEFINLYTLDVICATAMGVEINSQINKDHAYAKAVRRSLEIVVTRYFSPWLRSEFVLRFFPKLYKDHKECQRIIKGFTHDVIIKKQKQLSQITKTQSADEDSLGIKKKMSLIDLLLTSQDSQHFTVEDIQEEIGTFILAGHDTTASAIPFTLLFLSRDPKIQKKVYEEIVSQIGAEDTDDLKMTQLSDLHYLDMVVKEALRIIPSVGFIERKIETDCVIDGIKYPKDTTVVIYIYGMHHNPEYYPDPEKFDPDRFLPENQAQRPNFSYVPFSAGPRNCIGQRFAMNEIKYTLVKILQNFELFPVPGFKEHLGITVVIKSKNGVLVRLKKRN